jgi:hypothetical protein
METVSLIAVVEKVHVVTTFQFENQLYSGDIPTEQLFYCSGLKYDVDSHTLTDPEAEVRALLRSQGTSFPSFSLHASSRSLSRSPQSQ